MILNRPHILRPPARKILTPRMSLPASAGVKGGGAIPAVVPPGTPVWHYDFTDITLLFQDAARLTPITAAGQVIDGVNPTAYASETNPLATSATDVGTYEIDGLGGMSYLDMDGTQVAGLRSVSSLYDFVNFTDRMALSVCNAADSCQGVLWDTNDGALNFGVRHGSSATDKHTDYMDAAQTLSDNACVGDYAAWAWQDGSVANSYSKNSLDATTVTNLSAASTFKTNIGVNVGRYNGTGLPWTGRLYEFIVWEETDDNLPTTAEVEAYVTEKYGLAWT